MSLKISKEDRKQLKRVLSGLGRRKTKETIFYDLCFCLMAPQTTFKSNIKVIKELRKRKFYTHDVISLPQICKPVRFYNNKARYLREAKKNFEEILSVVKKTDDEDCGYSKREWLVKNVKGLGMKAASHFLRNLGYDALAIIDTHIIKFMSKQPLFDPILACKIPCVRIHLNEEQQAELEKEFRKEVTTLRGYENLEMNFQFIAGEHNLTTAELDALIWKIYSGTEWKDFTF